MSIATRKPSPYFIILLHRRKPFHNRTRHMIAVKRSAHNTAGIACAFAAGIKQIMRQRYIALPVAFNANRRRGACFHTRQKCTAVGVTRQLAAEARNALAQSIRNVGRQHLV